MTLCGFQSWVMKGEAASLLLTGVFAPEASGGHAVRKPKPTHVERPHRAHGPCQPHLFRPTGDPTGAVSWDSDHRAHGRELLLMHLCSPSKGTWRPNPQWLRVWVFIEVIKVK